MSFSQRLLDFLASLTQACGEFAYRPLLGMCGIARLGSHLFRRCEFPEIVVNAREILARAPSALIAIHAPVAQGFLRVELIGRRLCKDCLGDFARCFIEQRTPLDRKPACRGPIGFDIFGSLEVDQCKTATRSRVVTAAGLLKKSQAEENIVLVIRRVGIGQPDRAACDRHLSFAVSDSLGDFRIVAGLGRAGAQGEASDQDEVE